MTRKLGLILILVVIWLETHRFVLKWYKSFVGLP